MPQFDTSFLSSLVFWSIVSFGILMFLLYKYGFPALVYILEEREKRIRDSIADAERMKNEADRLLEDYRAKLAAAQQEAHSILEQARQRAQQALDENEQRVERETQKMLEDARRDIERERLNTIKELREHVADLVIQVSEKVLEREIRDRDHSALIRETLGRIGEYYGKN